MTSIIFVNLKRFIGYCDIYKKSKTKHVIILLALFYSKNNKMAFYREKYDFYSDFFTFFDKVY